jgi:hypothetical protein
MQICPDSSFGKSGKPPLPARFVKSDGMRTLVRKLRLCQSALGRNPTFVDALEVVVSSPWMTFLRLFFEKGIGTVGQAYKVDQVNQNLSGL